METLEEVIATIIDNFDFTFCIISNILTYLIIKVIEDIIKVNRLNTWLKRLVLLIVLAILGISYYYNHVDIKIIINSSILSPVFWSWVCKPICAKFNIDYNTSENKNNNNCDDDNYDAF